MFFDKLKNVEDKELKKKFSFLKFDVLNEIQVRTAKTSIFSATYIEALQEAKAFLLTEAYQMEKEDTKNVGVISRISEIEKELQVYTDKVTSLEDNIVIRRMTIEELEKKLYEQGNAVNMREKIRSLEQSFVDDPQYILLKKELLELIDALDQEFLKFPDVPEIQAKRELFKTEFAKIFGLKGGSSNFDSDDDSEDDSPVNNEEPVRRFDDILDDALTDVYQAKGEKPDWRNDQLSAIINSIRSLLRFEAPRFHASSLTYPIAELEKHTPLLKEFKELKEKFTNLVGPEIMAQLEKEQSDEEWKEAFELKAGTNLLELECKYDQEGLFTASEDSYKKLVYPKIEPLLEALKIWIKGERKKHVQLIEKYSALGDNLMVSYLKKRGERLKNGIMKLKKCRNALRNLLENDSVFFVSHVAHYSSKDSPKDSTP